MWTSRLFPAGRRHDRTGFNAELDELHDIAENNNAWMQNFEQKIKEETGIRTLKVGFNKVFGYYIEVSKGMVSQVPDNFVRKQTLVNGERYIVPELKEFENKILSAKEKIQQLEYYLFNEIRQEIRDTWWKSRKRPGPLGNWTCCIPLPWQPLRAAMCAPGSTNGRKSRLRTAGIRCGKTAGTGAVCAQRRAPEQHR